MYLSGFAGAEFRCSVGLLTNVQALISDMYPGWPSFNTLDSALQHEGLLLVTSACSAVHPSLTGLAKQRRYQILLGPVARSAVLDCILSRMGHSQLHCTLRDGIFSWLQLWLWVLSFGNPGFGRSAVRGVESQHAHQVDFARLLCIPARHFLRVKEDGSRHSVPIFSSVSGLQISGPSARLWYSFFVWFVFVSCFFDPWISAGFIQHGSCSRKEEFRTLCVTWILKLELEEEEFGAGWPRRAAAFGTGHYWRVSFVGATSALTSSSQPFPPMQSPSVRGRLGGFDSDGPAFVCGSS